MPQLRLALAQVNAVVGDVDGNLERVMEQARAAHDAGAHVLVTPEMVLTGYPIEDLAYRRSFIERSQSAVGALA